jgi:hypothetical protein
VKLNELKKKRGEALKRFREKAKDGRKLPAEELITAMAAADKSWKPIHTSTIYRLEDGQLLLTPELATRIAPHLGCTVQDLLIEEVDANRSALSLVALEKNAAGRDDPVQEMLGSVGLGGLTIRLAVQLNGKVIRFREWAVACQDDKGTITAKHGTPRKNLLLSPLKGDKAQDPVATYDLEDAVKNVYKNAVMTHDHKLFEGVLVFSVKDLTKHLTENPDDRAILINISEILLVSELRELVHMLETLDKEKSHGKT